MDINKSHSSVLQRRTPDSLRNMEGVTSSESKLNDQLRTMDLSTDGLEKDSRHVYSKVYRILDAGEERLWHELQVQKDLHAVAEAERQEDRQRITRALDASAEASRNISRQMRKMAENIDFTLPREEFLAILSDAREHFDEEVNYHHRRIQEETEIVSERAGRRHARNKEILSERAQQAASFRNILIDMIKIEEIGLGIIRGHQFEVVHKQMQYVQQLFRMMLIDHDNLRAGQKEGHRIELEKRDHDHRQKMSTREQDHRENIDNEQLEAERQKQERADALATKRVELEEHIARCRRELEMSKHRASSPSFWERLFRPLSKFSFWPF